MLSSRPLVETTRMSVQWSGVFTDGHGKRYVQTHSRICGVVISSLIPLIVPHRHGHWCRLCHSVRPERASWAAHTRRDRLFLHQPFALSPQFIDSSSPSTMYGPCTAGLVPCLTVEHRSISTTVQTITQRSSQGHLCSPHSKRIMTALNVLQVLIPLNRFCHLLQS